MPRLCSNSWNFLRLTTPLLAIARDSSRSRQLPPTGVKAQPTTSCGAEACRIGRCMCDRVGGCLTLPAFDILLRTPLRIIRVMLKLLLLALALPRDITVWNSNKQDSTAVEENVLSKQRRSSTKHEMCWSCACTRPQSIAQRQPHIHLDQPVPQHRQGPQSLNVCQCSPHLILSLQPASTCPDQAHLHAARHARR